jgi:hypothetical protein
MANPITGSGQIQLYVKAATGTAAAFTAANRLEDIVDISMPLARDINEYVTSDNKYKSVSALDAEVSFTCAMDPSSAVLAAILAAIAAQPPTLVDCLAIIGGPPAAGAKNLSLWYKGRIANFEPTQDADGTAEFNVTIVPNVSPPASQIVLNQVSLPSL